MKHAAFALCLVMATTAHANGIADGTAGLNALNKGNYEEAIRLFTRALKTGNLKRADREVAYLDRGIAFISVGKFRSAEADLRAALRLKPDDQDAQRNLQIALAGAAAPGPAPTPAVAPAPPPPSPEQQLLALWGALGTFGGQSWLETAKDPEFYVSYQWETIGLLLKYSGMDRAGNAVAGQYQLDPASGHISALNAYKGKTSQADVEITPDGFVETGLESGIPVRQSFQRTNPGSFAITADVFRNKTWQTAKTAKFILASPEIVQALGWQPKAQVAKSPSFLQGLGEAMKQGALAGLQDGVHDAVQARTRGAAAPKAYPKGQPGVVVSPNQ